MNKNKEANILILAGKGISSTILYNFLTDHFVNVSCIVEEKRNKWKWVKTRAKKLGWFVAIAQLLFQIPVPRILAFFSKKRILEIIKQYNLNLNPIPDDVIIPVKSVNSKKVINWIKEHQPDLIILNGTRIVSKRVLRSTEIKFINTHLGITPLYRGVHGGYWALATGDGVNFGSTIHYVDEGVDTGKILEQVYAEPTKKDNFSTYPFLQLGATLPTLKDIISAILEGKASTISPPIGNSKLWYHPTIFQYIHFYLKNGIK